MFTTPKQLVWGNSQSQARVSDPCDHVPGEAGIVIHVLLYWAAWGNNGCRHSFLLGNTVPVDVSICLEVAKLQGTTVNKLLGFVEHSQKRLI